MMLVNILALYLAFFGGPFISKGSKLKRWPLDLFIYSLLYVFNIWIHDWGRMICQTRFWNFWWLELYTLHLTIFISFKRSQSGRGRTIYYDILIACQFRIVWFKCWLLKNILKLAYREVQQSIERIMLHTISSSRRLWQLKHKSPFTRELLELRQY